MQQQQCFFAAGTHTFEGEPVAALLQGQLVCVHNQ